MWLINASSRTGHVSDWLSGSRDPRFLHIFDGACNLINEHREILSIVTPRIGNGPFNLVIEKDFPFSRHLHLESRVTISPDHLNLGVLMINTTNAQLWSPRPDWEKLHGRKNHILDQLRSLPISNDLRHDGLDYICLTPRGLLITDDPACNSPVSSLSGALVNRDIPSARKIASRLVGLGNGLTPAGDDFITGAIYAVWMIHPLEIAQVLAQELAGTAAPRTTSLSAAWLRSAGRGEAGILWHEFFQALLVGDDRAIRSQTSRLLSIGHTSGADALAGFLSVCSAYAVSLSDQ
jgi:hypothetical protein